MLLLGAYGARLRCRLFYTRFYLVEEGFSRSRDIRCHAGVMDCAVICTSFRVRAGEKEFSYCGDISRIDESEVRPRSIRSHDGVE